MSNPHLVRGKEWYRRVFEREPYFNVPFHVGFSIGGFELALIPDGVPGRAGVEVYWGVKDVQAELTRLRTVDAEVHEPMLEVGGGVKVTTLLGPFGNRFSIIENSHFLVDQGR